MSWSALFSWLAEREVAGVEAGPPAVLSRVVSVVFGVASAGSNSDALHFQELAEVDEEASTVLDLEVAALSGLVSSDSILAALRFLHLVGVLICSD